jgi:hypothetical protein
MMNRIHSIPNEAFRKAKYEVFKYIIDKNVCLSSKHCLLLINNNRIDVLDYVCKKLGTNLFLSINPEIASIVVYPHETIKWLHEHNILNQNMSLAKSIFKNYARRGKMKALEWLYERGYDLSNFHKDIAHSANLNLLSWYKNIYGIKDEIGMTYEAICNFGCEGKRVLLWLKNNNIKFYEHEKYLCHAIKYGNIKVARWLLKHCPKNILRGTVFKFSLIYSPHYLSCLLLKNGCEVTDEDKIYVGENDTVNIMLAIKNKNAFNPFVFAYMKNNF